MLAERGDLQVDVRGMVVQRRRVPVVVEQALVVPAAVGSIDDALGSASQRRVDLGTQVGFAGLADVPFRQRVGLDPLEERHVVGLRVSTRLHDVDEPDVLVGDVVRVEVQSHRTDDVRVDDRDQVLEILVRVVPGWRRAAVHIGWGEGQAC